MLSLFKTGKGDDEDLLASGKERQLEKQSESIEPVCTRVVQILTVQNRQLL